MTPHAKGTAMAVAGILVLSPDAALLLMIGNDPFKMMIWRGLGQALILGAVLVWAHRPTPQGGGWSFDPRKLGWAGVAIAACQATSSAGFVAALQWTPAANLLAIVSISPFLGALLSRLILGERIPRRTKLAIPLGFVAILIVAAPGLGTPSMLGDGLGLLVAVVLGLSFVMVRRNPSVPVQASLVLAGLLVMTLGLAFSPAVFYTSEVAPLVFLLCFVLLPLAGTLLYQAPRHITGPEVNLIMQLELPFGAFLVWLLIGQAPPVTTVIGGSLLIAVLVAHGIAGLRAARRAAAAQVPV